MSKTLAQPGQPKAGRKTSSLLKNLGITFFENVTTKGLSFLMILVLTRVLGPEDYGKYSFIFVTVSLTSALFDFGMENTAVRFAARDKDEKQSIFGLYLSAKLVILLLLVLFFIFGGQWFLTLINKAAVVQYLPYLIIGMLGESLFFVNDTYLQANQHFKFRAILNIARFSVGFLFVLFLLTSHQLVLGLAMLIYWVPLLFSMAFMGKYFGFLKAYWGKVMDSKLFWEIFNYEKWMLIYSVANNLLGRLDFFMLGLWAGFQQLGIYNAAFQLCAIVSFLPLILGKVLLPTLAELTEVQIFKTCGKMIRGTTLISVAAVILVPFSQWVVPLLLGHEYAASVTVLQILLFAFIAGLLSMPYEQALYSLGKPDILCGCRYFQLILIVILNCLLIPSWGIYAAAGVTLLGRVIYLALARWFYLKFESETLAKHKAESKKPRLEVEVQSC